MSLTTVILLLALVNSYVGLRLLPALSLGPVALAGAIAVLSAPVALAAASLMARLSARRGLARILIWGGSLTLGWVSSLLLPTLLRDLLLLPAGWLMPGEAFVLLRPCSAAAVPLLAVVATVVGLYIAIAPPRVVNVAVPLRYLPQDLQGFTIVQITDLHVGNTIRRNYVERIVQQVNAAHRPRSALLAEPAGFDLQLSGHTHGGQFWPWNLVVRYREPLSIGLDRLNNLWVYTSRGTGFWVHRNDWECLRKSHDCV